MTFSLLTVFGCILFTTALYAGVAARIPMSIGNQLVLSKYLALASTPPALPAPNIAPMYCIASPSDGAEKKTQPIITKTIVIM